MLVPNNRFFKTRFIVKSLKNPQNLSIIGFESWYETHTQNQYPVSLFAANNTHIVIQIS